MKVQQPRIVRKKLKPSRNLQAVHGWLTTEGDFYPCAECEHRFILDELGKGRQESFAYYTVEKKGWLKLQHGDWYSYDYNRSVPQAQLDFIFDWCQVHNQPLPFWIQT